MSNSVAAGCITGGAIGLRGTCTGLLFHVRLTPLSSIQLESQRQLLDAEVSQHSQ